MLHAHPNPKLRNVRNLSKCGSEAAIGSGRVVEARASSSTRVEAASKSPAGAAGRRAAGVLGGGRGEGVGRQKDFDDGMGWSTQRASMMPSMLQALRLGVGWRWDAHVRSAEALPARVGASPAPEAGAVRARGSSPPRHVERDCGEQGKVRRRGFVRV